MAGRASPRSRVSKQAIAPGLSPLQAAAAKNKYPPVPAVCVVTGGTGFVGQRLVEMLVERSATCTRHALPYTHIFPRCCWCFW
jgi:hypothetical protein